VAGCDWLSKKEGQDLSPDDRGRVGIRLRAGTQNAPSTTADTDDDFGQIGNIAGRYQEQCWTVTMDMDWTLVFPFTRPVGSSANALAFTTWLAPPGSGAETGMTRAIREKQGIPKPGEGPLRINVEAPGALSPSFRR